VTRTAALAPSAGTGPTAIVIGLDCITGLQTARLLARRGVPVVGIASNPQHFCARTRVCQEILRADTSGEELILTLEREAKRFSPPPVLFPCTDNSVRLLSASRDRLGGYRLALPEHDVVEMLIEKPSMERYAREHGFRVPNTVEIGRREDLEAAIGELCFPCVLKPAAKDARWVAHTSQKAFEVADAESLLARYDACAGWSDRFIVQEWIEGPESSLYSCNVYFSSGAEPLVSFVARKIRQWPPSTGTSALGVECRADEVCEETLRLFRGVGYHGLGYVEMKFDGRTGHYYLIEPNVGRPTGRSAIAEAGGVELLYTMYCDLVGLPLPERRTQTFAGAKWIYLRHDLQAAFVAWRRGELGVREWWSSMRGSKAYAVFSLTDPLPFVFDTLNAVREAARRLVPARTSTPQIDAPAATLRVRER
jgi:predicted ATP-grasp superfamily ATP-dependent carboligase